MPSNRKHKIKPRTSLSGYRLMWLIVMFDLPVVDHQDRKTAVGFRDKLLMEGFSMAQFSVYFRFCPGQAALDALSNRIVSCLPEKGKVDLLTITDRQFGNIRSFRQKDAEKMPENLDLFVLL